MLERDDEKGVDVTPPQPDERLGASNYADGPRSRLGGGAGPERPVRASSDTQKRILMSLLGHDPATRKLMGGAVVIVLLLLVAVGAWSVFGKRHQGVPVIAPPAVALRDRPADPGGMQIMSDDTMAGDVTGKGEVHLAPPAEQPDARVLAHRDGQSPPSSAGPHPLQSDIPAARTETVKEGPVQHAPVDVPGPTTSTLPNLPTTQSVSEPPRGLQSDMTPPQETKSVLPPVTASRTDKSASGNADQPSKSDSAQTDGETTAEARPPAPTAPVVKGAYQVQLAALDSREKAQRVWSQLQERFPDLFEGRTALYSQTTHNGRTFVRLRMSGFADIKAARAFCAKAQAQSVSCTPAFF